jgi:hypothetical protein
MATNTLASTHIVIYYDTVRTTTIQLIQSNSQTTGKQSING